jgi:ferredoxin
VGQYHRWASDVYPLDEDGSVDVHLMEVPSELAEQATWGASACPVRAITIVGPPLDYWIERRRASRTV